eukprot:scaffold317249_cov32-Tisochrysis_lutea.AAC.1
MNSCARTCAACNESRPEHSSIPSICRLWPAPDFTCGVTRHARERRTVRAQAHGVGSGAAGLQTSQLATHRDTFNIQDGDAYADWHPPAADAVPLHHTPHVRKERMRMLLRVNTACAIDAPCGRAHVYWRGHSLRPPAHSREDSNESEPEQLPHGHTESRLLCPSRCEDGRRRRRERAEPRRAAGRSANRAVRQQWPSATDGRANS